MAPTAVSMLHTEVRLDCPVVLSTAINGGRQCGITNYWCMNYFAILRRAKCSLGRPFKHHMLQGRDGRRVNKKELTLRLKSAHKCILNI